MAKPQAKTIAPDSLSSFAASIAVESSPSTVWTPSPTSNTSGSAPGRVWSGRSTSREPQSPQSVPNEQSDHCEFEPPSSQPPSPAWKHVSRQPPFVASAWPAMWRPSEIDVAPMLENLSIAAMILSLSSVSCVCSTASELKVTTANFAAASETTNESTSFFANFFASASTIPIEPESSSTRTTSSIRSHSFSIGGNDGGGGCGDGGDGFGGGGGGGGGGLGDGGGGEKLVGGGDGLAASWQNWPLAKCSRRIWTGACDIESTETAYTSLGSDAIEMIVSLSAEPKPTANTLIPARFATSAIAIAVESSPSIVCSPSVSTSITLLTPSRDGPRLPAALQRPLASRSQQPHETRGQRSYAERSPASASKCWLHEKQLGSCVNGLYAEIGSAIATASDW